MAKMTAEMSNRNGNSEKSLLPQGANFNQNAADESSLKYNAYVVRGSDCSARKLVLPDDHGTRGKWGWDQRKTREWQ